jgi:hypothetical protein
MVSIVKDKTDLDSWFSAKPIIVGNLSNILAGTELNLRQDVNNFRINCNLRPRLRAGGRYRDRFILKSTFYFVHIGGS